LYVRPSLMSLFQLAFNLQQEVRFVESTSHTKDRAEGCYLEREDYFECLHSKKEFARIRTVLEEKKAQEYEAKHGVRPVVAAAGGGGH
jgi:hypothetical protein